MYIYICIYNPLKSELFTKQACRDAVVVYSLGHPLITVLAIEGVTQLKYRLQLILDAIGCEFIDKFDIDLI